MRRKKTFISATVLITLTVLTAVLLLRGQSLSQLAGILYFQSLPEIQTDGKAGKKTLAVALGMDRAFFLFQIWWPIVCLLALMLRLTGKAAWPALLSLGAAPFYLLANRALRETTEHTLLALDNKGFLVRRIYLVIGIALILGVIFQ